MNLQKAPIQKYTTNQIQYIEQYFNNPKIGSEVSCYRINNKQVLKIFDMTNINFNNKLLIPNSIYGNNTYIFVDKIIEYRNKIYAYTMKYIEGPNLSNQTSLLLFYNLTYNELSNYLTTLINDSKQLAQNGIEVYDCYKTNIILNQTGFKQIDCIDFIEKDLDPTIIEQENIKLMCQTIYDCLFAPYLTTFIANNNLQVTDFLTSPDDFVKELKNISQNYSDNEIITLNDTKKLSRKK